MPNKNGMQVMCHDCIKTMKNGAIFWDAEFDETNPTATVCPHCHKAILVPLQCCGKCIESANLSDGVLICCPNSTQSKLICVPYNNDSEKCDSFQTYELALDQEAAEQDEELDADESEFDAVFEKSK